MTTEAAVPRSKPWFTLGLLVLLGAVAFLDRQVISLLVGPIKADLGVSDTQIGLLQGLAFGILYATCAVPIGYAVDRHSRRLVIFFGVLIWGLAASASGLMTSFAGLLVARVFVGMGEAALGPAAYSILSDIFDRRRLALVLSIYSIGSSLGAATALTLVGFLIGVLGHGIDLSVVGQLRPWQSVLFLTGLPGLLFCSLIFVIREPARTTPLTDAASSWSALRQFISIHKAFFAAHFAGFACMMAIAYAGLAWLPSVLTRGFGWSIGSVGLALGGFTVTTGIFGLLFNGFMADRWFARGYRDAHLRYYAFAAPVIAIFGLTAGLAHGIVPYLLLISPVLILANFAGVSAAAVQIVTPSPIRGKMSALYLMVV
ncbi:MAG: MFS transporter, partial [Janthinobacterium lividum]